jgi:tetratricopeptide (TPR) repeat protein
MSKSLFFLFLFLLTSTASFAAEKFSTEQAFNFLYEGVREQRNGEIDRAKSLYQKALVLNPDNQVLLKYVLNNMGSVSLKSGNMQEAEEFFLKALKIDPQYLPAKINMGFVYDTTRDELTAIKYWLSVLNMDLRNLKPKDCIVDDGKPVVEGKPK